ncbi:MAG: type VI secretion system tip protein VgrG [Deltaproteobacteria bacterium]|jgi:type VI secretion system secreted protein VgrG|nr:type VI secretion system tip protein VgrG [Deltaproteobacteria bacterium]
MAMDNQTKFDLSFSALPELELHVLRFKGKAALNSLYALEITALVKAGDLKGKGPEDFFAGGASLRLRDDSRAPRTAPGGPQAWDCSWNGVVTGFRKSGRAGDYAVLEISLEPALSMLRGQVQSRIHLGESSCDIVRDSLVFGGLAADGFRFAFDRQAYPKREFAFQHEEDLESFVMRILEREGIGLSFDQTGDREIAVFTDANSQFPPLMDGQGELVASAADVSGLGSEADKPRIFGMRSVVRVPKAKVRLKDYNWENPNRPLEVRLDVCSWGRGEIYLYGENFDSLHEGRRLAGIRKEEELWGSEAFVAESRIPGLMPGLTFEVEKSGEDGYDGRYVVAADEMAGSQAARVAAGLGVDLGALVQEEPSEVTHRLALARIDLPYRPARSRAVPKIAGQITAWIDGEGSGDQPEMDGYGRYKVLFPLDVSGRGSGKASGWVRMAQPYTGAGYGQNFPLTPGTEVLVAFVDGNPDRPVITGSVANAETGSLVNSSAPNAAGMGTKGGGSLMFSNEPTKQNVTLSAGSDRGHITLASGSPTTAALYADVVSTTTTVNNNTSTFLSSNAAGYQYAVKAGDDTIRRMVLVMASLRQAVETAAEAAGQAYAQSSDSGVKARAELANNVAAIVDYSIAPLQPLLQVSIQKCQEPDPDPRIPDPNLITISGDSTGSKAVWASKTPYGANTWAGWLTGFLLLMKPLRDISTGYKNIQDFEHPADPDKVPPPMSEDGKRSARGVAYTTEISKVTADIISLGTLLASLWGAGGAMEAKGILIHNKDSYVDVLSNTWAGVSAKGGPLLLESNSPSCADDMRCAVVPGSSGLSYCLASEADGAPVAQPKETNGILLHGKLVRTMADELSLTATQRVVAKTYGGITLATGLNAAPPAPPVTGYNALSSRNVNVGYDRNFGKGVDISALDAGSQIRIQTAAAPDPVNIICGSSAGAEAKKLSMAEGGVKLQNGSATFLDMQDGGVALQLSDTAKLSMEPTSLTVQAAPGNALAFSDSGAKLSHSAGLELSAAGGAVSVKLTETGFEVASPLEAKLNGQIIQLG